MKQMKPLNSRVSEAMDNALDNRYCFDSAEGWASDLITGCSDIEGESLSDVIVAVNRVMPKLMYQHLMKCWIELDHINNQGEAKDA